MRRTGAAALAAVLLLGPCADRADAERQRPPGGAGVVDLQTLVLCFAMRAGGDARAAAEGAVTAFERGDDAERRARLMTLGLALSGVATSRCDLPPEAVASLLDRAALRYGRYLLGVRFDNAVRNNR